MDGWLIGGSLDCMTHCFTRHKCSLLGRNRIPPLKIKQGRKQQKSKAIIKKEEPFTNGEPHMITKQHNKQHD